MSANKKTLLASALAHGLLFALLAPWLTLATGAVPKAAEVRGSIVAPTELVSEPKADPAPLPPPPEELPPVQLDEPVPPEEAVAEAPIFDRPDHTSVSTAFDIPRERSIAVRSARNRRREPAPEVASAPPPVRTVPVSAPTRRAAGPTRKAVPVSNNAPPNYPRKAVERALEGVVLVAAQVDRDGTVVAVTILSSSGYAILDREALRAVESWQFRPALRNGVPVRSRIEVPIRFQIS